MTRVDEAGGFSSKEVRVLTEMVGQTIHQAADLLLFEGCEREPV